MQQVSPFLWLRPSDICGVQIVEVAPMKSSDKVYWLVAISTTNGSRYVLSEWRFFDCEDAKAKAHDILKMRVGALNALYQTQ